MKSSQEDRISQGFLLPQFHCAWMTAGVLAYQLCDRQFDCDNCPLDMAMRGLFSRDKNCGHAEQPGNSARRLGENSAQRLYSRNHCWVQPITENTIRVGLATGFASVLLSPRAIVLPSKDSAVERNQRCFWIVLEGGTIPGRSPVDGIVRILNPRVAEKPHEVFKYPENEGWLFELEIQKGECQTANLLREEEAFEIYSGDMLRFQTLLSDALKANRLSVGVTLPDGGQTLPDVSGMLGARRYSELVRKVFA